MLVFSLIGISSKNDGLTKEVGYWSEVEYTESVIPGYPEYFPLILKFRSLGRLPADIQQEINYTNTVKISSYYINFNLTGLDTIDKDRDSDELIGSEKSLELRFRITKDMVNESTALRIEIKFEPFNLTGVLSNDFYILEVEFKKEGTGGDILKASAFTVLPMVVIAINYKFYMHVNSKFIRNIRWKKIPVYYLLYLKNSFIGIFSWRRKKKVRDLTRRMQ